MNLIPVLLSLLLPISTCGFVAFQRPSGATSLSAGRSLGVLEELVDDDSTISDPNVEGEEDPCLVDFGNFWRKTRANFTFCEAPLDRQPDFKSKGSKGSKYWDNGDHIVRYSNHWSGQHGVGRIVDCEWEIDMPHEKKAFIAGKCKYVDFQKGKLNEREKKKLRKMNKKKKGFK